MNNNQTIPSNRQQVIKSSIWVFGGQFFGQFLRLVSNLIMTRLLVPDMFGVMAIANTMIIGLSLCTYMGLQHNIIQSDKGDDQEFLNAAWAFQIIRGAIVWVAALLISLGLYLANVLDMVPVGSVYAEDNLPAVLAVLSFNALISGFESINKATAARHMRIDKITLLEISSQIIGLLTMVGLALIHQSIWALVVGTMMGIIANVILSYIILPGGKSTFLWCKKTFVELFHFGKWILLTTTLGFFISNADKLILGALITPEMLGIYTIAFFLTTAVLDIFFRWASSIVLPIFSRVYRDNRSELKHTFYKYSFPFNIASLFVFGILFNAGYILIEVLYDSRYSTAGPMIQILSISLLGARVTLAEQCYVAVGKPKFTVPMKVIQLITLFTLIVPAYRYYGMNGALYVIAGNVLLTFPVTWYLLRKLGILDWKKELITLPAILVGFGFSKLIIIAYNNFKLFISN